MKLIYTYSVTHFMLGHNATQKDSSREAFLTLHPDQFFVVVVFPFYYTVFWYVLHLPKHHFPLHRNGASKILKTLKLICNNLQSISIVLIMEMSYILNKNEAWIFSYFCGCSGSWFSLWDFFFQPPVCYQLKSTHFLMLVHCIPLKDGNRDHILGLQMSRWR